VNLPSISRHPAVRRAALATVAVAVLAVVLQGRTGGGGAPSGASPGAIAGSFFERYVDADGRVVRRDQGGDTVSEGQAYAMLLAVDRGDEGRFAAVWSWTRRHLQRPDGLLSWRWRDGAVVDPQPASDADVDAARALALAAERFSQPGLRADAAHIAGAVLDHETVTAGSRTALAAGRRPLADAGRRRRHPARRLDRRRAPPPAGLVPPRWRGPSPGRRRPGGRGRGGALRPRRGPDRHPAGGTL